MSARIEVFKGQGAFQPWRFRLVEANNKIVSQSEGYFSKWNAKRAARKIAERMGIPVLDKTEKSYKRFGAGK